ncbi:ATP-grasp domain-containing protein [Halomonas daqingensis]|uniref:ATP-grasp domain-containing protein n=1 Tax=Billgrantia desiderata TaxID=52021 RepID=A0ABS9B3X8_9GAMM|nr:biotin carboxylase N-terminal domain-containing protein [Halomonas desiderata]MCE8042311.1 ATP-grasp domain-containing protein [Halomonas desiderata]MCE8046886.1 ATP-grasp domain-containing protein [Halomonas desiderata]
MNKVLIANRGEIACRIIKSCRKLGLTSVAVYSEADAEALHVKMADEAYPVGPASAKESYLVADKVLKVALDSGAHFVHPGYGFLSESSRFARAVEDAGLTWVGPSPQSIDDMGDKERAREIAKAAGVPILPGSPRFDVGELNTIEQAGEAVGYPLLVKASAGGGGIGMRLVERPEQLLEIAQATQSMAEKAFGDGTIFLERFIANARHVEVQVFGFGNGEAIHLYERDCSLQRRYQKVIEESTAPGLPEAVREKMVSVAASLCQHQKYSGAGTVEFVVDADTFDFFFLEMNTRIQVEHPVTEMCTGTDLVAMQLKLAQRDLEPVKQESITHQGHAIECRIYAENPDKNFMPSPGPLNRFKLPDEAHDTRIDCGFQEGDKVTFFYDPMIAKVICHAETRKQAIERMLQALDEIEIEGVKTNTKFLISCLKDKSFVSGKVSTGFIDKRLPELING